MIHNHNSYHNILDRPKYNSVSPQSQLCRAKFIFLALYDLFFRAMLERPPLLITKMAGMCFYSIIEIEIIKFFATTNIYGLRWNHENKDKS